MVSYIILGISIVLLALYLVDLVKHPLTIKKMTIVSMCSAISYVLYLIQFIKYPQGGGISLFSMLPVMLLSILYGRTEALTSGLIFGLLKLLNGATVVHPAQFLLDYVLSTMALGLAGTFGTDKKIKIIFGGLFAVALSVLVNIISGAVYFGEYAPPGMNIWLYSIVYNCTSAGFEGLLSVIILAILPIKRIKKALKIS